MANVFLLEGTIKKYKATITPYAIAPLDIQQAFNRADHKAIFRTVKRMQRPLTFERYVFENLSDARILEMDKRKSMSINIERGVKQVDPLSPLLFKFLIDELLSILNDKYGSIKINDTEL